MREVPEHWRSVLVAIRNGPVTGRTPSEVAFEVGLHVEETTDLLATLDVAGLIEVKDVDAVPLVALSPLGASVLGVRVVERGREESPAWQSVDDPRAQSQRARGVAATNHGANFDFLIDPTSIPASRLAPDTPAADPGRPTILLGLGLNPWPNEPSEGTAVCPVCGTQILSKEMYCLFCDRWGAESASGAKEGARSNPIAPRSTRNAPTPEQEAAKLLEARVIRKQREKNRLVARAHQHRLAQRKSRPSAP